MSSTTGGTTLMILVVVFGYWMSKSDSAVMDMHNNNKRISTKEKPFLTDKYCFIFPPTYCLNSDVIAPEDSKTDVQLFREQFCPSQKRYICVEKYARHCMPNEELYQDYLTTFLVNSIQQKEKGVCATGPFDHETLIHVECIRSTKSIYEQKCPFRNAMVVDKLTLTTYTFDNYMECLQLVVSYLCGPKAESFLRDYLLAMNNTFGYNQPIPKGSKLHKFVKLNQFYQ